MFLGLTYRQSTSALASDSLSGEISTTNPWFRPGDVAVSVDLQGHLCWLRAAPPRVDRTVGPLPEEDWSALFEAGGLDIDDFEPTAPTLQPPDFADLRRAWTGVLPGPDGRPVRVEAASYRGRPVYFNKVISSRPAWSEEVEARIEESSTPMMALGIFMLAVLGLLTGGAVLIAVRNLRLGRGDRKGAMRLAILVFSLRMLHWIVTGHHVGSFDEIFLPVIAICGALGLAVLMWVLYIALEPYIRRLWPQALVSWSRALAGKWRDPLVGRDVLIGFAWSAAWGIPIWSLLWWGQALGWVPLIPDIPLSTLRGGRFALGQLFSILLTSLAFSLAFIVLFLVLRLVLRKTWLAAGAFALIYGAYLALAFAALSGGRLGAGSVLFGLIFGFGVTVLALVLLIRFGLLASIGWNLLGQLMSSYPVTADVAAPYFAISLLGPIVVLAIAVAAFKVSLAGRPLFTDEFSGVGEPAG